MTTLTDTDVLAATLWGEARGEPIEGKIAVACVIRNRLATGRWGKTYTSVCRATKQFSCWNSSEDANHVALMALVARVQQGDHVEDAVLDECYWVAQGVIGLDLSDRSNHATHYHVASMNPRPKWALDQSPCAVAGSHLFYRNIA